MNLRDFFASEKIEYFAVLPYNECRETRSNIMNRESFTPRSVIIYLLPYYTGRAENVSVYATSLDYHIGISEINARLIEYLKTHYPTNSYKGYGDHSPIDERHAALIGGLGILGDSGLLINEKYGTYAFIADLITDIDPSELGSHTLYPLSFCEHCGACKRACPTGVLRGESTECLSAITQKKGTLTEYEIDLMQKYNTVWGCDLCQSSCPHNKSPKTTPIEFFHRERISALTSATIDGMSDEEFSRRAFAWRGRAVVERNLKALKQ